MASDWCAQDCESIRAGLQVARALLYIAQYLVARSDDTEVHIYDLDSSGLTWLLSI